VIGRRQVATAALVAASVVGAACTKSVSDYHLPGGATSGREVYHVTVVFDDVLDLVPQAGVQVDDITVGQIEKITLNRSDLKAHVQIALRKNVKLPANAVAELRQTSLLGEKFVALGEPTDEKPTGELADGAVIPCDDPPAHCRSKRNPEVEEVFSALAALLNGGGLGQLQTIATELSAALAGKEANVRSVLARLTTFTGSLAGRKGEIVRALENLDRLATTLVRQKQTIVVALDDIAPALRVLNSERTQLVRLLGKLSKLGTTTASVISTVRADTLANLNLLSPLLDTVLDVRGDLTETVKNLERLTVLVPRAIPGDFLNLSVTLLLDPTLVPPPVPTGPVNRRPGTTGPSAFLLTGVIS
jgi:phospholipid/cholesterol/gamma-HCH transport system substrate-binding protein